MRAVYYLNQFFGQIGGEEAADHPTEIQRGAICKGISKNSCSFLAFLLFTFILIAPAAAQTLKEHDITLRVQNEPVESVFNKITGHRHHQCHLSNDRK